MNFDWLDNLVEWPNVSTTNCNLQKVILFNIIGDLSAIV